MTEEIHLATRRGLLNSPVGGDRPVTSCTSEIIHQGRPVEEIVNDILLRCNKLVELVHQNHAETVNVGC